MIGRVLSVAESDSSGGGGIQADIKTVMAMGGYAATALSSVTAQNTKGVSGFQMSDPAFVAEQMRAVLEDIGADAIKTGMLVNEQIINSVSDVLDEYLHKKIITVVDPSIVSRGGDVYMDEHTIATLKRRLLVRAFVLTPNLKEAELLTGMHIRDIDDMKHAADMMRTFGAENVVLKAGRVLNDWEVYLVAMESGEKIYEKPVIRSKNTQGAGATLSSGIAVSLAQGLDIHAAVERSLDFLHLAIEHAPGYGHGTGPMNHAFEMERTACSSEARKKASGST